MLALAVRRAQAVLKRGPKSLAIDLAVKSSNCLLEQPGQMTCTGRQGLELGLKLELSRVTNGF